MLYQQMLTSVQVATTNVNSTVLIPQEVTPVNVNKVSCSTQMEKLAKVFSSAFVC